MTDIIERAARDLFRDDPGGWEGAVEEGLADGAWRGCIDSVKIVLRAIRDIDLQTQDGSEIMMLMAGQAALPEHDEPLQEDALNCWQAMIDAALNEGDAHPTARKPAPDSAIVSIIRTPKLTVDDVMSKEPTLKVDPFDEELNNPLSLAWKPTFQYVHDWRGYVGDRTRALWATFGNDVKYALACDAQEKADCEDWD